MKKIQRYLIPALMGLFAMHSSDAVADYPTYLPNSNGKSLTTPVAWGASNNVIFLGAGGTAPSPYSHSADGAAILGAGIGDPVKNLGFQFYVTSIDISAWQEYSASFHLFRELGCGSAFGVGLENVMITNGGDSGKSYYAVFSQGVQTDPFINNTTGNSQLTYSIGVGSGRFGNRTPADLAPTPTGGGHTNAHGTYVFGNIAYEVAHSFNVISDWNGTNLNAGLSKTFFIEKIPVSVTVGAADLTKYSGDGVRLIATVGTGFAL